MMVSKILRNWHALKLRWQQYRWHRGNT